MKTVFFHIPKTAGTFLANQYKKVLNYNVYKFFSDNNLCEFLDRNVLKRNLIKYKMVYNDSEK